MGGGGNVPLAFSFSLPSFSLVCMSNLADLLRPRFYDPPPPPYNTAAIQARP